MKYLRNWKCAICDHGVIYDSETDTLTCNCGTIKNVIKDGKMKPEDLNIINFRIVMI